MKCDIVCSYKNETEEPIVRDFRNFVDTYISAEAKAETTSIRMWPSDVSSMQIIETDLLGTGSSGAARADVSHVDVAPRQARLSL